MKLSQAVSMTATTPFYGWDGLAWVANVTKGSLQVYDRFISARDFGQKKRVLLCPIQFKVASQYEYLRAPDQTIYLIESANQDDINGEAYAITYSLTNCQNTLKIVSFDTTANKRSSGADGPPVESLSGLIFCDMERYTSENSKEFDDIKYSSYIITMASSYVIDTDNLLDVEGVRFEVKEVNSVLLTTELRALKSL